MTPHQESLTSDTHVDCDAALERLFDYLDGELDDSFEARLKEHVQRCKPCLERADFERRFLVAVQTARSEQCCPKSLRERVLTSLRSEGLGA